MTRTLPLAATLPLIAALASAGEPAAEASSSELQGVIAAVEAKYKDVDALSARFVQTTKSSVFGDETQSGELKVKRPSMMRWTFEGEGGKEFVTDGSTMWIYSKADNQVLKYQDVSAMTSQADNLLQSLDKIDDLFVVKPVDDGDAAIHTLALTPKDGEAQFKALQLVLDQDYLLRGVTMTDTFDNVTELAFTEVDLKANLPDTAFAFTVPEGADLVDAGGL